MMVCKYGNKMLNKITSVLKKKFKNIDTTLFIPYK